MRHYLRHNSVSEVVLKKIGALPPAVHRVFFEENGTLGMLRLLPNISSVTLTQIRLDDLKKHGEIYLNTLLNWADSGANADYIESRTVMAKGTYFGSA